MNCPATVISSLRHEAYFFRVSPIPDAVVPRLAGLRAMGILESLGRGRGQKWFLARRYHEVLGTGGAYTRLRGLDFDTNKALLLRHLRECGDQGAPMGDLQSVLPSHSRLQIREILLDLRTEGLVVMRGRLKGARWFEIQKNSDSGSK